MLTCHTCTRTVVPLPADKSCFVFLGKKHFCLTMLWQLLLHCSWFSVARPNHLRWSFWEDFSLDTILVCLDKVHLLSDFWEVLSPHLVVNHRSRAERAPHVSWRVVSKETQRCSDSHRIHFHRTGKTNWANHWHQVRTHEPFWCYFGSLRCKRLSNRNIS